MLNGEDIKIYRDNVYNSYQDARKLYVSAKKEHEDNYRKRTAEPVKVAIKINICRILGLMTVIDKNLESENIHTNVLLLDKTELQSMINLICEYVSKLYSIECHDQDLPIQKEIDEVVSEVYTVLERSIYIYMSKLPLLNL